MRTRGSADESRQHQRERASEPATPIRSVEAHLRVPILDIDRKSRYVGMRWILQARIIPASDTAQHRRTPSMPVRTAYVNPRRESIQEATKCPSPAATRFVAPPCSPRQRWCRRSREGQAPAGYPNRAIRFIVPYAPGGFPDTVARILAQRLSDRLGQSVVIDNRPGANGGVAAGVLTSAPADGYQFLVTDGSMFSINPLIYSKLTYDPEEGLRAGRAGGARAVVPGAASEGAGEQLQGVPRLREGATRARSTTVRQGSAARITSRSRR